MSPIRSSPLTAALGSLALLSTGACSRDETPPAEAEAPGETLAAAIAEADELGAVASALGDSGLAQVFDGAGSYTLFAPNDAAFAALGERGEALRDPRRRAALAAVLRDHIVAGYLTPQDIEAALDAQAGRRVEVVTMGDHVLSFSRTAEGIRVTGEDGASAMLTGDSVRASNGVAIAIDGLVKRIGPPAA